MHSRHATLRPRLGFLGAGGTGRRRMAAIAESGVAEVAAFCDPSDVSAAQAQAAAPGALRAASLDTLLGMELDGIVIATPRDRHAAAAIAALDRGIPVLCRNPLGRSEAETAAVVAAADRADRLVGADFSYRGTAAARALRNEVASGGLGEIFAVDLVFHTASGPVKPWRHDRTLSGGGCVIDRGAHLIDLALWILGFPAIEQVAARLHAAGSIARPDQVEDYASAQMVLATGTTVRLACSWRLHAGAEAEIGATFHGTRGSAGFHNIGGGYDAFAAVRNVGSQREMLVKPEGEERRDWAGQIAARWAQRLANDPTFDTGARELIAVAGAVERIYRSAFAFGSDGRRYQSVEPFPHPLAAAGGSMASAARYRRNAIA